MNYGANRDMTASLQRTRDCHDRQDWQGCLQAADETLARDPDCLEAELLRATALLSTRRFEDAIQSVNRVIDAMPDDGGLYLFLVKCFMAQRKFAEALPSCRRAVELLPRSGEAHYLLGACLKRSDTLNEAMPALSQALALDDTHFQAWNDLADIHVARGAIREALQCWRQSLHVKPRNLDAMSSLGFYAAFDPEIDARQLFELKTAWGRHLEAGAQTPVFPEPHAGEPLRIGYLAYDLCDGMTARFLEPVLAGHDRSRFHVTGYHGNEVKDSVTQRLGHLVDSWQDVSGEPVPQTVQRIRADRIDILVLASSYRGRDLRVLAHRAAPIQVCYLNRIASTGLQAVDYLVTDELSDPLGGVEDVYTEALVRLTNHTVYLPPASRPAFRPPPCTADGRVTFGSFNNHAKINDRVVETWSEILRNVPDSRLILRSSAYFGDPATQQRFIDKFAQQGIAGDRLRFQGMRASQDEHLDGIQEADIALDPFPFNGGTTSLEALWVGVPVISMACDSFMGRQGLRCLTKTGQRDLVVDTQEDYVTATVLLAADPARLTALRSELPPLVERELFDYRTHVTELETAYRFMWSRHRDHAVPQAFDVAGKEVVK